MDMDSHVTSRFRVRYGMGGSHMSKQVLGGPARPGPRSPHNAMSRRAAMRRSLTNYLALEMSVATKKPLPPALKALQPILDTLPLEKNSEGETEAASIKDFTVRVGFVLRGAKANYQSDIRPAGIESLLSQGRDSEGIVSHERWEGACMVARPRSRF